MNWELIEPQIYGAINCLIGIIGARYLLWKKEIDLGKAELKRKEKEMNEELKKL